MASDTPPSMGQPSPHGQISLSGGEEDADTLRGYFEGLAAGGTITVPLEKAPWGDYFGMLVDRFGVTWLADFAD